MTCRWISLPLLLLVPVSSSVLRGATGMSIELTKAPPDFEKAGNFDHTLKAALKNGDFEGSLTKGEKDFEQVDQGKDPAEEKDGQKSTQSVPDLARAAQAGAEGMIVELASSSGSDGEQQWLATHSYRPMASQEYQKKNAEVAMQARAELKILSVVPEKLFKTEVLPYQHFDEPIDEWRADFYTKLMSHDAVKNAKNIKELAEAVIPLAFTSLGNTITFKSNFTPQAMAPISEVIKKGHASCTGLSILVANALRSVGVPARVAGIAEWNRPDGGNHNWVEVWTGGRPDEWHFIDAAPMTKVTWDQTWFNDLVHTSVADGIHGIYTPVWDKLDADSKYTVLWRDKPFDMPALQRTAFYKSLDKNGKSIASKDVDIHKKLAPGDLHANQGKDSDAEKTKADAKAKAGAKAGCDTEAEQKSKASSHAIGMASLLVCMLASLLM